MAPQNGDQSLWTAAADNKKREILNWISFFHYFANMKCDNASKIIIFYNEILTRKVDLQSERVKKIRNQLFSEKYQCI